MVTSEVLQLVDIPRHKLYYLEQKGFVRPRKVQVGEREFRNYSPEQVERVRVLWKYLSAGFRYSAARQKAEAELGAKL
jgi:DNA-binding transcriptional MerR regulator